MDTLTDLKNHIPKALMAARALIIAGIVISCTNQRWLSVSVPQNNLAKYDSTRTDYTELHFENITKIPNWIFYQKDLTSLSFFTHVRSEDFENWKCHTLVINKRFSALKNLRKIEIRRYHIVIADGFESRTIRQVVLQGCKIDNYAKIFKVFSHAHSVSLDLSLLKNSGFYTNDFKHAEDLPLKKFSFDSAVLPDSFELPFHLLTNLEKVNLSGSINPIKFIDKCAPCKKLNFLNLQHAIIKNANTSEPLWKLKPDTLCLSSNMIGPAADDIVYPFKVIILDDGWAVNITEIHHVNDHTKSLLKNTSTRVIHPDGEIVDFNRR